MIAALMATAALTGVFPSKVEDNWASALAGPCKRCVAATSQRMHAPVSLPERAIVYSFAGEFATKTAWSLINLDTGKVTQIVRNTDAAEAGSADTSQRQVAPKYLNTLRAAAIELWRSKPHLPRTITIIPGAYEEAYVVSGGRMANFSYAFDSDSKVVRAVHAALENSQ